MKYLSRGFIFAIFLSLASTPLFAQTPDGTTPSDEAVCDDLLVEGTTPGLYGLCVAYCEAQDCDSYPEGEEPHSCNLLLSNYERKVTKADNGDPAMPCAGPVEPMCPCWSSEGIDNELEAGGMGLPTVFPTSICGFDVSFGVEGSSVLHTDFVSYSDGQQNVVFLAGPGVCFYRNTLTLDDENPNTNDNRVEFGISPEQEQVCRDHIVLRSIDFDFCIGAPQ